MTHRPPESQFLIALHRAPSRQHRVELAVERRGGTGTPGEVDLVDSYLGRAEIVEVPGDDGVALRGSLASERLEGRPSGDAAPEPELDRQGLLDHERVQVVGQIAAGRHRRTGHDRPRRTQYRPRAGPTRPAER